LLAAISRSERLAISQQVADYAENQIQRCHPLLAVNELEATILALASDDAAEKILRARENATAYVIKLVIEILKEPFDVFARPNVFSLKVRYRVEILEELTYA
jgi:hypothetical protein